MRVLVAMPWRTGPCANVLALGTVNPGWQGGLLPGSPIWLVPVGLVLATLLVSVGPVVARLRRLALAVRQSAASGFTGPIPGEGDDEIGELAAAFRAVSGEVQVQLAARDARERSLREFVTSTTHDVMIPLTVLKAHLATLDEERAAGRAIDPAALTGAMAEAHYLGALLHNLGLAARLDAFDPEAARAPTDLTQVVERVLARHRPIARQLDVSLDGAVPDRPLVVDADQTMIEQAVSNLVYNGVRHNRPGGHVGVSLDRDESGFRVRIVDDGPGVPEGELDRLRQRGARGDEARTRAPDGQGLGLSIAGRVADAFGLTLRFARSEFGGLEVVLSGPLAPDPVSPGRPP